MKRIQKKKKIKETCNRRIESIIKKKNNHSHQHQITDHNYHQSIFATPWAKSRITQKKKTKNLKT
jgi:hypothetical protein